LYRIPVSVPPPEKFVFAPAARPALVSKSVPPLEALNVVGPTLNTPRLSALGNAGVTGPADPSVMSVKSVALAWPAVSNVAQSAADRQHIARANRAEATTTQAERLMPVSE
jgi:hypothetical protein